MVKLLIALPMVALGALLLARVSVFTSLPLGANPSIPPGYTATTQVDDLRVTLNINPGRRRQAAGGCPESFA